MSSSKIFSTFNEFVLCFLNVMAKSFKDCESLQKERKDFLDSYKKDPSFEGFAKQFESEVTSTHIGRIYDEDETVLSEKSITWFQKCQFPEIFPRLEANKENPEEDEILIFWTKLKEIGRFSSMLRAIGPEVVSIESDITKLVRENPERFADEKTKEMELIKEMMSGGDLSQKICKTLQDKNSVKKIFRNLQNVLRPMDKNAADGDIDLNFDMFSSSGKVMPSAITNQLQNLVSNLNITVPKETTPEEKSEAQDDEPQDTSPLLEEKHEE